MHRRPMLSAWPLLLAGLWFAACGNDVKPLGNQPPTLTGPTAQATDVSAGDAVALTVDASDPEGDALTFTWTQNPPSPAGTFSDRTTSHPTWTAPEVTEDTTFLIGATVSDGKGGVTHQSVEVLVRAAAANQYPVLAAGSPGALPSSVVGAAAVQLSASATDADGDALTYAWTQEPASPAGTFSSATAANPTWTAPVVSAIERFTLRVTVSDPKGGTVQGTVSVDVAPPVPQNTAPTLTAGPSASSTTTDEKQSITLSVSASDVDGDTLTYVWTQTAPATPVGIFSSTSVANPTWTAPDVNADGTYTLRVTVSDGQGGNVQGTIDIAVKKVNQPPTVAATITAPGTLLAGDTGSFSITASDPDGDPLTYSWNQTAPATQGTWVGSRTGSSAQWYSPVLGAQTSFTLSVSVTDGQSTPVVRTVTVPVTVPHYTDVQTGVFNAVPCTGCHGTAGQLNLGATVSYSNLVNVTAINAACNTLKRVAPGDPDNSMLVRKIEGTACGNRMPRNNPTYFDTNPGLIVRIRSWILAGAAND
jgi:hypothetical protein